MSGYYAMKSIALIDFIYIRDISNRIAVQHRLGTQVNPLIYNAFAWTDRILHISHVHAIALSRGEIKEGRTAHPRPASSLRHNPQHLHRNIVRAPPLPGQLHERGAALGRRLSCGGRF
jgi:hypothetical protein